MLSADDINFLNSFLIQIFIAIFGFSMQNAIIWVQTSLVSVQGFLKKHLDLEKKCFKF